MSAIWLLMGLLLLSYIGSLLVGGRAVRGGLASGAEYVVLGFVLGPMALGLLERTTLDGFEQVAGGALGWLVFVFGLTHGVTGGRRAPMRRIVAGWIASLVSGAAIAAVAWSMLTWRGAFSFNDRLIVAGGVGAACAETTRYAARWVVERHRAKGPLSSLAIDLAESGDLVPLLAVAALFAFRPAAGLPAQIPPIGWIGITLGLGAILGGMAALLLGKTFRLSETWGVLLGMSMLAIGTSWRLGLSTIAAMFVMGATLAALSPHNAEVSAMVSPTERPVLLPALLLAGAHVTFGARYLPWLIGAVVVARVIVKMIIGLGIFTFSRPARAAGARIGPALLSAGPLAMAIGLAFSIRFPGAVGSAVLATAAICVLFGELVGPISLRAALARAGEIPEETRDPESPAKADASGGAPGSAAPGAPVEAET